MKTAASFDFSLSSVSKIGNEELDACIGYAVEHDLTGALDILFAERAARCVRAHRDNAAAEAVHFRYLDVADDATETSIAVHMTGCPFCHASEGGRCISKAGGRMKRAHWQRIEANRKHLTRYGVWI